MYSDILNQIDLFKNATDIKIINSPNPDRTKLKVSTSKKNYFVKIDYRVITQEEILFINKLMDIYNELNIPTNQLIDIIVLNELNCSVLIYDYIDGTDLENSTYSDSELLIYGKQTGKYLSKLKLYSNNYNLSKFDIDNSIKNISINLNKVISNSKIFSCIQSYLSKKDLLKMLDNLIHLAKEINFETTHLIHGDVKAANVMIDNNHNLFIVDVDAYDLSYDIFNLKWHMLSILKQISNCNEYKFYAGFLDGFYHHKLPNDFDKQLYFISYFTFLEKLSQCNEKNLEYLNNFLKTYSNSIKQLENSIKPFLHQIRL